MEMLWVEKWRPKTTSECVFPAELTKKFADYVESKDIPNLLLTGSPGVGKTTVARALLNDIGADSLVINASMYGNIDTLRTDVVQFASTVSFGGGRKFVILDEADYLNPNSTQPALRNFIEEYSSNCGFILTCNFPNRIIEPLRSRLAQVDFTVKKSDAPALMLAFMKRACYVLDQEKVQYDKQAVAQLVAKHFPDFRKVLNELQAASHRGKIDSAVLSTKHDIDSLITLLTNADFDGARKWIVDNADLDHVSIMRALFDKAVLVAKPGTVAVLAVLISKYQYQASFVADQEINLIAFLVDVMKEWELK